METKSIVLYLSYVGRGAPSNSAGGQTGLGRTVREAHKRAGHWANQAPWAKAKRVIVSDLDAKPRTVLAPDVERALWHELSIADGTYLPATDEGRAIVALANARRYASAIERLFAAQDAGVELCAR